MQLPIQHAMAPRFLHQSRHLSTCKWLDGDCKSEEEHVHCPFIVHSIYVMASLLVHPILLPLMWFERTRVCPRTRRQVSYEPIEREDSCARISTERISEWSLASESLQWCPPSVAGGSTKLCAFGREGKKCLFLWKNSWQWLRRTGKRRGRRRRIMRAVRMHAALIIVCLQRQCRAIGWIWEHSSLRTARQLIIGWGEQENEMHMKKKRGFLDALKNDGTGIAIEEVK